MARLNRVCPVGVPQHVIQRGNNKQVCFIGEQDFLAYKAWLKDCSKKYQVDIHAWVLMSNHVHLLCTPRAQNAVSHMMQALGRYYVRYFNANYQRTGTLWDGRFRSCLVQEENYLLQLYRYIEMNPVRAGMVSQASDYVWSSYPANALGKPEELCTPHPLYQALGREPIERQYSYRDLFRQPVDGNLLENIRLAVNKGRVLGNGRFEEEIENLTGCKIAPKKMGRPVGWRKSAANIMA